MALTNLQSLSDLDCILWYNGDVASGFAIAPLTPTYNGTFGHNKFKDRIRYLKFDGSTNSISFADDAVWNFHNGNMTILGWIRKTGAGGDFHIARQEEDGSNYWQFYVYNDSNVYMQRYISGTSDGVWNCAFVPSANTWYHVAITKSGTSTPVFYVNGVVIATTAEKAQTSTTEDFAADMVMHATTAAAGYLKDMMIFTRALTQDQVGRIMQETYIY